MDYDQMYVTSDGQYVMTDGRNAPVVVDRRRVPYRPAPTTTLQPAAPVTTAPMIAPVAPQYQYAPAWAQPMWAQRGWGQVPGYVYPPTTNLGSILGGFGDLGSLASIAAQIFAAFLPLPAAPTPQDNNDSDSATNAAVNSSNLIRYQNALAQFAKRDQQILTIGSVLKELLKRPGFPAFGG